MKKEVRVGSVLIGGVNPVSIQSMSNIDTRNVSSVLKQIDEVAGEGCQLFRLAVNNFEAAEAFGKIRKKSRLPLVADIHFDYRLALEALKNGADKIRINPGNIGEVSNLRKVVEACKERNVPIRIGVNGGSLEKDILEKHGGITAKAIVESGERNIRFLEDMNFEDIVISLKVSDPKINFNAYKMMNELTNYPLHIGVTEAGSLDRGIVKSSVGIGALLLLGIGNTLRVSLTGDPLQEIRVAKMILSSAGIVKESIDVVSCPTCGRTKVKLEPITQRLEEALKDLRRAREKEGKQPITLAVMGCEVNGPGEAKSADIGVACGNGRGAIFLKGEIVETVDEAQILPRLIELIKNI